MWRLRRWFRTRQRARRPRTTLIFIKPIVIITSVVSAVLRVVGSNGNLMVQLDLIIIELSATNARTEPAELAYILANYSPSSGMVGMVMVCNYARQGLVQPAKKLECVTS